MKLKTFRLISQFDSLSLGLMTLIPDVRPVGILQFSHGMTERKERYLEIMKRFAEKGYVCIINDHRGHGESVKSRTTSDTSMKTALRPWSRIFAR